jgi:hypothetical protein
VTVYPSYGKSSWIAEYTIRSINDDAMNVYGNCHGKLDIDIVDG